MDLLSKVREKEEKYINEFKKAPQYLVLDMYSYTHLCGLLARDEVQYYEGLYVAILTDESLSDISVL